MVASKNTIAGTLSHTRRAAGAVHRWRQCCASVLVLLAALLGLSPAVAASVVDIAAVVGFNDTFQPGRWMPLSVTVTGRGRDVDGELEVQVTGGDELRGRPFVTSHRRRLELHGATRKTLQFTVLPRNLLHPLVIRVLDGGHELARTEVDLRTRVVTDERLLLVLSRDANLDYLNDSDGGGLRVLYPHPELLPVHWRGYDAVAGIVVHGLSLERLSTDQFEALHKWIAQGGIVAVSGGADYPLLRTPRLASLLPGVPQGMARLGADALKNAFPALPDSARPVQIHRVDKTPGRVLLRAADLALVVERGLGLGRVLYLTFDVAGHPFAHWEGMRRLWLDSLRLPTPSATALSVANTVSDAPILALVRAEPGDFAPYVSVLLFLALYVGLLLAGYHRSVRAGLSGFLPLWSWAVPAVFAVAAWGLFGPVAFPRGASAAVTAAIEPLPDSPYARLDFDLGVYANRSGAMRFEYRGARPVLYPRQGKRGDMADGWLFGEGPRPYLEPQDPRRYVLQMVRGEDVITFDFRVLLIEEAGGLKFMIDNASGRDVEGMRLVFDGVVYELGSLAAGARNERRLERARDAGPGKATWPDLLRPAAGISPRTVEPARIVLERTSRAAGTNEFPRPGHALLLGYATNPLRPSGASAGWPRREQALVTVQVPVRPGKGSETRE
jgi:hypothetical protein